MVSQTFVSHPAFKTASELSKLGGVTHHLGEYLKSVGTMSVLRGLSALLFLFILPPLLLFYLFYFFKLQRVGKKLQTETARLEQQLKAFKAEPSAKKLATFLPIETYVAYKEGLADFRALEGSLLVLAEKGNKENYYGQSKAKSWLDGVEYFLFKPFSKFYHAIETYTQVVSETLQLLDTIAPQGNHFSTLSENELWENRVPVYDYLL